MEEIFYREMAQAVLLFGSETRVLSSENGEEVRGHTHGFSEADHGEASATESRRDMGDSQDGSSEL